MFQRQNKRLKMLHQQMVRRLAKEGFAGPKLWRQWDEFMLTAESRFAKWELAQAEEAQRKLEIAKESEERKLAMAHEINNRRNEWNKQAQVWIERVGAFNFYTIAEQTWIGKIETCIRTKGAHSLPTQQRRFFCTINRAHKLLSDSSSESHEVQVLIAWMQSPQLNKHQQGFCRNYAARLSLGYRITENQKIQYKRLSRKMRGALG